MIEEGKYSSEMMKKHFNKELVMTKEDDEDFENSTKCWICDNAYVDGDDEVGDHFHMTGKYKGSVYRDYSTNVKLKTHKMSVVFHNLKSFNWHLIMQELGTFN